MASPVNAALCALLATAFWSLLGYALTRHLLPRVLAVGAAPVIGWAVHSAATLPIFFLIGFSPLAVVTVAALCVAIAAALALPLHVSGWEADIGLTWFTAFASLSLLMGISVWLSKRSAAAIWIVALAAAASLREVL